MSAALQCVARRLCTPLAVLAACLAPAASAGVELEVIALDGRAVRGQLSALAPDLVLFTEGGEATLAWSDVLAVQTGRAIDPKLFAGTAEPLRFELADGSRFAGSIVEGGEREFVVRVLDGQTGRLRASLVQRVVSAAAPEELHRKLATEALDSSEDVLLAMREGQSVVLRGAVKRIEPERVVFAWRGRELPLSWGLVVGAAFAQAAPRGAACLVRLADAQVFAGRVVGGDEQTVRLRSSAFENLALPWSHIARIDCHSERLTYLSDLRPAMYEFEPYFRKRWDYAGDVSLSGGPIRLGGRTYAKGICTKSRALLVYRLDGRYRQFAATVGILDEMGPRGDVTAAVLGDGRPLWEMRNVRGGQAPRDLLVDVAGVEELGLLVDYGEDLDLSDHVAWGLARLIR